MFSNAERASERPCSNFISQKGQESRSHAVDACGVCMRRVSEVVPSVWSELIHRHSACYVEKRNVRISTKGGGIRSDSRLCFC